MDIEDPYKRRIIMQITSLATCDICYKRTTVVSFIEKRTILKICHKCLMEAKLKIEEFEGNEYR